MALQKLVQINRDTLHQTKFNSVLFLPYYETKISLNCKLSKQIMYTRNMRLLSKLNKSSLRLTNVTTNSNSVST
jgi:hypothetical protein